MIWNDDQLLYSVYGAGNIFEIDMNRGSNNEKKSEKIRSIIAEVLNIDTEEIQLTSTFIDDLGADSLDVFQIIMGIEEEYDIEIPQEEAEKIVTVGDAVEQIRKLNA